MFLSKQYYIVLFYMSLFAMQQLVNYEYVRWKSRQTKKC